jgi:hypothetical protein
MQKDRPMISLLENNNGSSATSPKPRSNNYIDKCLGVFLVMLVSIFSVSLFKNISYPLLWADESITVMHGKRVLEYGYPKVHDGKNVVYDLRHPNKKLGIDEKTDAYIGGANWGMYYVAAVAVYFAEMSDDLYTKTAILRIPFAFAGLAGLALLAFLTAQFFSSSTSKKGFWVLFVFFELISISLVLHLREARYYSPTVFLTALVIAIYIRYSILKKIGYRMYAVLLTVSLFLLFLTFSPVYFIFLVAIFLYESISTAKYFFLKYSINRGHIAPVATISAINLFKHFLKNMLPLMLSIIAVIPLIFFFKTFYIADEMAKYKYYLFGISKWGMYLENLKIIWRYFTSFDFIYLAIFLKVCLLLSFIWLAPRNLSPPDTQKLKYSNFLTVIFIVYFFAIARIPNYPFTRYFIPLQPILALIIIMDLILVYNIITHHQSRGIIYFKTVLIILFAGFIFANISRNMEYLSGHVYEMSHQYKGPLDHLIPFIKEKYKDTDKLIIATNYEETSFMYYLDSKVIIGYVGNNLEQDMEIVPDIVVYRKGWKNYPKIFVYYLESNTYERISFPFYDYKVNNIPDLIMPFEFKHQFYTLYTQNELNKIAIYLKR